MQDEDSTVKTLEISLGRLLARAVPLIPAMNPRITARGDSFRKLRSRAVARFPVEGEISADCYGFGAAGVLAAGLAALVAVFAVGFQKAGSALVQASST